MTWIPFLSLFLGFILGGQKLSKFSLKIIDKGITLTLILLMFIIGASIGINSEVMSKLVIVWFKCAILALLAIAFSVLFIYIVEKTVLPLKEIKEKMNLNRLNIHNKVTIQEEKGGSHLIWIMPVSILQGIIVGVFILPSDSALVISKVLTFTLVILYIGVGISLGSNRSVFKYLKMLGWKIIFISIAILLGSLVGGIIGGKILNLPYSISVMSVSGMSYYSITGAFMTNAYGIEAGTYGFVVNVMREFFTVLTLPLLTKISSGSPIAGGAAGNMDVMLAPITKFIGAELGLLALITGTILTFLVPFILPLLYQLFLY